MKKEQIKSKIKSQMPTLRNRYKVKKIGIFGSTARNEHKKMSDIDIMVEFNSAIGFFDFIRLENFLSGILKKKVDLISKKAIKPAIKKEILKEIFYV